VICSIKFGHGIESRAAIWLPDDVAQFANVKPAANTAKLMSKSCRRASGSLYEQQQLAHMIPDDKHQVASRTGLQPYPTHSPAAVPDFQPF
jgi:hypothetical protein